MHSWKTGDDDSWDTGGFAGFFKQFEFFVARHLIVCDKDVKFVRIQQVRGFLSCRCTNALPAFVFDYFARGPGYGFFVICKQDSIRFFHQLYNLSCEE